MTITIREPANALTHLSAMILSIFAAIPLIIKYTLSDGLLGAVSMSIFMISMILLYGASGLYHSVTKKIKSFKKLDHCMIFLLIAGSYTPICLLALPQNVGHLLLFLVWMIAFAGIIFKLCWVTCPKWVSSVLYIAMGWLCLSQFMVIYHSLKFSAFIWLLIGGIIYTIGGIIYALKLPVFDNLHPNFTTHTIFHLFVVAGSIAHYICMYFI